MEGLQAFALGGLAQSSLLLAGLAVYWFRPTTRVIRGLAGFGAAALAAGGLLAMLTDSLMPYTFQKGGAQAGIWTVVGFAASLAG